MFELALVCPEHWVEHLSDTLQALDALSVSVEDADAQTSAEQALFGEPGLCAPPSGWQRSRVTALYATQDLAKQALALLQAQDCYTKCQLLGIQSVPEQDWVRLTQAQFAPVEITPAFWIVPSWHSAPAQAQICIELDPGLAFGTGTHPTTRMCLRWIAAHGAPHHPTGLGRTLDYGCGSGILAIGAAKHGASAVDAVDIDEAAVTAGERNAQANGVKLQVGRPESARGVYQTVLANILAAPLKMLAPLLWSRVAANGSLVLAGILARQADELTAAYAPYCSLQVCDEEDGWVLMTAQRPSTQQGAN
jgi:ribosomal protein L11 methyltransferase